jgi:phosphoglycerate dehydrogenase-like enzyme
MADRTPVVMLHTDAPDAALEIVRTAHPDLLVHACTTYADLPAALSETQAEVVYGVRFAGLSGFPRAALIEAGAVRWVSVGGSGVDHLGQWDASRMTVTNAAGVASGMMAEYALGAMLSFSLDLREFARAQAARDWSKGKVRPIAGRTVLIVGLGHTGQALAQRAAAMGMNVLGVRARPAPMPYVDETHGIDALLDLLPRADFVMVCVPLLASTQALIGAKSFAAMRPGTVLIDVSRGGVVDEDALIDALKTGRIGGAALDVFASEPLPADHVFWGMENVILTPHCSAVYDGWDRRSVAMFAENLWRYRRGDTLENIVNPERGY